MRSVRAFRPLHPKARRDLGSHGILLPAIRSGLASIGKTEIGRLRLAMTTNFLERAGAAPAVKEMVAAAAAPVRPSAARAAPAAVAVTSVLAVRWYIGSPLPNVTAPVAGHVP